jgi:uncharacterized phage protein (TIGR02218 family)
LKAVSEALKQHLASETTTLATCWLATLQNGTVYGFTSHSSDIVFGGRTYAAATGITPSAIASNADLAVDNLDVDGMLDASVITEADIAAGLWDYAAIEIFMINWSDLSMGQIKMRSGRLGEVKTGRVAYTAELRGLAQNLQQVVGELYSPTCRASLGDARCKVSLAAYTHSGTVASVQSQESFSSALTLPDDYCTNGRVTFLSGQNSGLAMEVIAYSRGVFTLALPMPYTIAVGDTFTAVAGCQKQFLRDCVGKFANAINFRGEPYLPGNDVMTASGYNNTAPSEEPQT